MAITKENVFYCMSDPGKLASLLNSLGDTANTGDITGLDTTNKTNVVAAINEVVADVAADEVKLAAKSKIKLVAGAAAEAEVALGETVAAVTAVFAVTTATGAVATKFLLADTTDYTVGTNKLTMVTDQSANTLIVIYKVA